MKLTFLLLSTVLLASCAEKQSTDTSAKKDLPIVGTWKLLSGTTIEKGDTTVTDYTTGRSFIKVINDTHFAFLNHDLSKGQGASAVFGAGGGSYSLQDSLYTERLEYCNDRAWEGHDFTFTITIDKDTLVQQGVEKVANAGIDRINIERYVRVAR